MRFPGLLILTVLMLSGCDANMQAASEVQGNHLSFKMVEIEREGGGVCEFDQQKKPCVIVKLRYPEMFSNTAPSMAETLNAFIQQQIMHPYAEGLTKPSTPEQLAEQFIAGYEQDASLSQWALERNMEIPFNTERLITFALEDFSYTGGAHPASGKKLFVRSREDGSEVSLADLLNPGYEIPLNVMGESFFRESRGLSELDSLPEQGFSFENGVFALNTNFGVVSDGLKFIFEPYEIAPYAMGFTEFVIPFENANSLVNQTGLLGASYVVSQS